MPKILTGERYAPTNEVGIVYAGVDEVLWQLHTCRKASAAG